MGGVKAGVGIRVQNAGCWYPLFEDRSELLPLLPCALTTTYQYVTPQSIDASLEDAQLIDVAGDSMVLVVAGGEATAPCGVPLFVSDHWPSSDTPAFSHFRIRRSILRSATRCSMNFKAHS